MKKVFVVVIAFFSLLLISGCDSKTSNCSNFNFDQFNLCFHTNYKYSVYEDKLDGLGYGLLNNDIISMYKQDDTSGFVSSLIINKRISDKSVKDYIAENMDLISIDWFKNEKSKLINTICNGERIELYVENSKLKNNLNNIYFSQTFFKHDDYIYIVSFSTENIVDRDQFSNDIKNLSCK